MSNDFISKLEAEAKKQSKLQKNKFLPASLAGIVEFYIKYPWQVLTGLSFMTTLLIWLI